MQMSLFQTAALPPASSPLAPSEGRFAVPQDFGRWTQYERAVFAHLNRGDPVVVCLHRHKKLVAWAKGEGIFVRIDRQTKWGNPYALGSESERSKVCEMFAVYLEESPLMNDIGELVGMVLGCHCAPRKCHGDVLAKLANALGFDEVKTLQPSSKRIWSTYQEGMFTWGSEGSGHALVNAVAGSGKTTSLVELAKRLRTGGDSLFVAFNKHIAAELSGRLENTPASTLHSVGYAMLRDTFGGIGVDGGKYRKILRAWLEEIQEQQENAPCWGTLPASRSVILNALPRPIMQREAKWRVSALLKIGLALFDAMRCTMETNLWALALRFSIDATADELLFFSHLLPILARVGGDLRRWGCVDFTDMIYLAATLDEIAPTPKAWVFVDEAQDLNVAQRSLVAKLCGKGTRVVFVGDERQAIYGFSGADIASYRNIRAAFNTNDLPLSICYRCPTSHIELAQTINPTILAAPNAKSGYIESITETQIADLAKDGDLVLCRVNAPLMGACLRLVARGRRAFVRGREVGKQLARLAEDIQSTYKKSQFLDSVSAWVEKEIASLRSEEEEVRDKLIERIHDQRACLAVLWSSPLHRPTSTNDVSELVKLCSRVFAEDDGAGVCFSSIHRSKGLEAERTFLLPPQPPHPKAKGWELEQEMNLIYVSYTRAKEGLFFVDMPVPCAKKQA
jgi:hypothetical protein